MIRQQLVSVIKGACFRMHVRYLHHGGGLRLVAHSTWIDMDTSYKYIS